jgi:NAD(P)-dependent dehydrogenase (short-subunit alcohol dehydrogenase family)
MNKIAVITGANRGIGFETARQLGKAGVTVLMGARNMQRGSEAAAKLRNEGIDAHFTSLDVVNYMDHDKLFRFVKEKYGRLDILINNAGAIFEMGRESAFLSSNRLAVNIYKKTFEINFFQVIALTQKLLPLLMESDQGRIVNVSSILASLSLRSDPESDIYSVPSPAYSISKTALNAFTIQLAQELRETSIKVNAAQPGWVKTAMGGPQAPMEVSAGAQTSVRLALLPPDGPTGKFFHFDDTIPW